MTKEADLQWHPAFYAGIQIELAEESENLIFEEEHLLGTKPTQIDVLIVKKEKNIPIKKNIGRIFRKHNIIEYKSPTDYLSIDDFYKVYAYACYYKSDVKVMNSIPVEEITITYVSEGYPRELIKHLQKVKKYRINEVEKGIYSIEGDIIPMQILVTGRLTEAENLWLHSLTNKLKDVKTAERLTEEYQKHKHNMLYESVVNIIVKANQTKFEEVHKMISAFKEILADEIKEGIEKGMEEETKRMKE